MDPKQLLYYVIRPVIDSMGAGGSSTEKLLLMIAAHESRFHYLHQIGGPARGLWQMEPDTLDDLWNNWLAFRPERQSQLIGWSVPAMDYRDPDQLYAPHYACAAARLQLIRVPEPIPEEHQEWEMAEYAKKYWNTQSGKATPEDYLNAYTDLVKKNYPDL